MNFVDFIPSMCMSRPTRTTCNLLGVEWPCLIAYHPESDSNIFLEGQKDGQLWTFLCVFFFIGLYSLSFVKRPWNFSRDGMKIITGLYAIDTSFFALFRYAGGFGKPLMIVGALHNLCEWIMIIHVAYGTSRKTNLDNLMIMAVFWIFGLIVMCMMHPVMDIAFLGLQSTGIMLDIAMPMMFLEKYYDTTSNNTSKSSTITQSVKEFYLLPALAHLLHILFTILPLVLTFFHAGSVSWYNSFFLEFVLYLSVPMTHVLYCTWAWEYDRLMVLHSGSEESTSKTDYDDDDDDDDDRGLIPQDYRIKDVKRYIITGFAIGLMILIVIPFGLMGFCEDAGVYDQQMIFAHIPNCIFLISHGVLAYLIGSFFDKHYKNPVFNSPVFLLVGGLTNWYSQHFPSSLGMKIEQNALLYFLGGTGLLFYKAHQSSSNKPWTKMIIVVFIINGAIGGNLPFSLEGRVAIQSSPEWKVQHFFTEVVSALLVFVASNLSSCQTNDDDVVKKTTEEQTKFHGVMEQQVPNNLLLVGIKGEEEMEKKSIGAKCA